MMVLTQRSNCWSWNVWDNHSVSVGNDTIGTLAVHGHGGSNAAAALDTTAAGDLWDSTLGISGLLLILLKHLQVVMI